MTTALDSGRPFTGNERELLENTLDLNRSELVRVVDGLSDAQAHSLMLTGPPPKFHAARDIFELLLGRP